VSAQLAAVSPNSTEAASAAIHKLLKGLEGLRSARDVERVVMIELRPVDGGSFHLPVRRLVAQFLVPGLRPRRAVMLDS
jgi:hypothetical protein